MHERVLDKNFFLNKCDWRNIDTDFLSFDEKYWFSGRIFRSNFIFYAKETMFGSKLEMQYEKLRRFSLEFISNESFARHSIWFPLDLDQRCESQFECLLCKFIAISESSWTTMIVIEQRNLYVYCEIEKVWINRANVHQLAIEPC